MSLEQHGRACSTQDETEAAFKLGVNFTEFINLTSFGVLIQDTTYLKQKSQLGHSKVHNVAGLEWSTHRHIVGGAVGGYLFNPVSVLLYEHITPIFPNQGKKDPLSQ